MTDESKTCPHCGKKLRRDNTRGACSKCLGSNGKPRSARGDDDDGVLDRMGWGALGKREDDAGDDEAPPKQPKAARALKRPQAAPVPAAKVGRWQGQLLALAAALGLDGEELIESYCRDWVESTRARALAPSLKQLPAGEQQVA